MNNKRTTQQAIAEQQSLNRKIWAKENGRLHYIDSNKLIAEFMDWKQCDPNDNTIYANPTNGALHSSDSDMRFHTSWDWLMPVVASIDDEFGKNDNLDDMINLVHNSVLEFDINIIYQQVVEFIKEYNN